MTEREIRQEVADFLRALDRREAQARGEGPGPSRLRKALLPAALGATMLLNLGCEATPITLPYMAPMDDYGPPLYLDKGPEAAPDSGPADAQADSAKTDALRDAGLDYRDAYAGDDQGE